MAFCFRCGAIMHDDDAAKHTCDPSDVPVKGQTKRPVTTTTTKE